MRLAVGGPWATNVLSLMWMLTETGILTVEVVVGLVPVGILWCDIGHPVGAHY